MLDNDRHDTILASGDEAVAGLKSVNPGSYPRAVLDLHDTR
jgi:hypothetical protein